MLRNDGQLSHRRVTNIHQPPANSGAVHSGLSMADDNESWIIYAGDAVIKRSGPNGIAVLEPLDRLVYCLWVADYGMRNAGDLSTARDLYKPFHKEALQLSKELALPVTQSAFGLSGKELERQYFEQFEGVCDEIRAALSTDFMLNE